MRDDKGLTRQNAISFEIDNSKPQFMRNARPEVQLDAIDRAILRELQQNGRLSNLELAQRIHLSASACLRRVKRLEETGVIAQYVALLDAQVVGRHGTSFTIVNLESMNNPAEAASVAELKVIEDDGMLFQCLDYYDHVAARIETYARLYFSYNVDPTQPVRLLLVAPSFSQTLINRCKWIDAQISLFTYSCIKLEKSDDIIPVFSEQAIPSPPDTVVIHKLDDHLSYITDAEVRTNVSKVLDQIKQLKPSRISMDALKYAISMKVDGRVFAYLHPRRKHYLISTFNADDKWTDYSIQSEDDLSSALQLIATSIERRSK